MPKTTIRTHLNNITRLKDGSFSYDEELVWSKWVAELDPKPDTLMSIIEKHFSHDLHTSDSAGQHEPTSDQPTNKESIE